MIEMVSPLTMESEEVKNLAEDLESGKIMSFKKFNEEMGVAGGNIAGIGIPNPSKPNQAEPGVSKKAQKNYKKKNKIVRRNAQ